jgi:hypothetical protein
MREIVIGVLLFSLQKLVIPVVCTYVTMLARKYVKNDAMLKALQSVGQITKIAVTSAAQQTVVDLKDPTKPGSWDKIAQAAVKRAVSETIRAVGSQPLETLAAHGWTEKQTDALIDHGIEGEVHILRASTTVVPPLPVST